MKNVSAHDPAAIAARLSRQAESERIRITAHAHQEMVEEAVVLDDILCVLRRAMVIESYPDHKRGPCCLVYGRNAPGRDIHVVCTTALDPAMIITVHEPKPPKWKNPFTRGKAE